MGGGFPLGVVVPTSRAEYGAHPWYHLRDHAGRVSEAGGVTVLWRCDARARRSVALSERLRIEQPSSAQYLVSARAHDMRLARGSNPGESPRRVLLAGRSFDAPDCRNPAHAVPRLTKLLHGFDR